MVAGGAVVSEGDLVAGDDEAGVCAWKGVEEGEAAGVVVADGCEGVVEDEGQNSGWDVFIVAVAAEEDAAAFGHGVDVVVAVVGDAEDLVDFGAEGGFGESGGFVCFPAAASEDLAVGEGEVVVFVVDAVEESVEPEWGTGDVDVLSLFLKMPEDGDHALVCVFLDERAEGGECFCFEFFGEANGVCLLEAEELGGDLGGFEGDVDVAGVEVVGDAEEAGDGEVGELGVGDEEEDVVGGLVVHEFDDAFHGTVFDAIPGLVVAGDEAEASAGAAGEHDVDAGFLVGGDDVVVGRVCTEAGGWQCGAGDGLQPGWELVGAG